MTRATGITDVFFSNIPFIMEGQVVDTSDPDQMGRARIWVPSLDGANFKRDELPWAEYASPFFGFTIDYPAGGGPTNTDSHSAYGFWAIPKVGASVLVFFLNGDPTARYYFASTLRLHRNRSLPAGRNVDLNGKKGPFGDAGDGNGNLNKIEPAYSNLRTQFQDKIDSSQAQTRGAFERTVAQPNDKDGTDGYAPCPIPGESYLDPQTYAWTTPGRHAIILQDYPKQARVRVKTAEGHQIILDDANERIYISTAKGKSWVELDQDGHIHVFGADSISVRSGEDINLYADRDINLEAGRGIHAKTLTGDVRVTSAANIHIGSVSNTVLTACGRLDVSSEKSMKLTTAERLDVFADNDLAITTSKNLNILAGGNARHKASRIDLNGPAPREAEKADCAQPAQAPPVVPGHEPWSRPATKGKRGSNWKE